MGTRRDFMVRAAVSGIGAAAWSRGAASAVTLGSQALAAPAKIELPGAYLALWFQLGSVDEPRFAAWFHKDYLPALSSRPGIAWVAHYRLRATTDPAASFVRGPQQLMLLRADRVEAIIERSFADRERAEVGETRTFLDLRQDVRTDVLVPISGLSCGAGVESAPRSLALHAFRSTEQAEPKILRWFAGERAKPTSIAAGTSLSYLGGIDGWADAAVLLGSSQPLTGGRRRLAGLSSLVSYTPGSPFDGDVAWSSSDSGEGGKRA